MSRDPSFTQNLTEHIRSGYQCILIATTEEARCEREIAAVAEEMKMGFVVWDQLSGLNPGNGEAINATEALLSIPQSSFASGSNPNAIVVFRDLHNQFNNPDVRRAIRSLTSKIALNSSRQRRPLILLQPTLALHPDLASCVTTIDFRLPNPEQLNHIITVTARNISNEAKRVCPDDVRHKVVQGLRGLSSTEASDCLALCLVRHQGFHPDMVSTIEDTKANMLKRSEILTYVPREKLLPSDNIGGYDELFRFIRQRAVAYTAEAEKVKLDMPNGIVLAGIPGCVADDTIISYCRGNRPSAGDRKLPISEFCAKFNDTHDFHIHRRRAWDKDMPTYLQSFDADSGKVIYNLVKGVYPKGKKHCVRITTAESGSVTLTYDHPVLTSEALFAQAGGLEVGDQLLVRGSMKPRPSDAPPAKRRPRVVVEGLKYHGHAWAKEVKDRTSGKIYTYQRTHKARLVMEAYANKIEYDEFIRILKTDPEKSATLFFLNPEYEVHHINEDPTDDRLENLMVLTKAAHTGLHHDESNFNLEYTSLATITRIEDMGERETYDVSMEYPYANFVVNDGIIVHNTGKSVITECIAHELGLPLVNFDFSAVFNALVGESERRTREVIHTVEALGGALLVIDEADKALGGSTGSSGDSGVTLRVFGQILTWLARKNDRTFVVMTLNRTTGLPPELLRKGRFDEIFYVDVPSDLERRIIFEIHMRKRGIDPSIYSEKEWASFIKGSTGMVGAEVEESIKSARFVSFQSSPENLAIPSSAQILACLKEVAQTMVTKVDADSIKKMREFGETRARPVSAAVAAQKSSTGKRNVDIGGLSSPYN